MAPPSSLAPHNPLYRLRPPSIFPLTNSLSSNKLPPQAGRPAGLSTSSNRAVELQQMQLFGEKAQSRFDFEMFKIGSDIELNPITHLNMIEDAESQTKVWLHAAA